MTLKFLELDGWRVPVLDEGANKGFVEVGSRGRAFSGKYRSSRRALKRRFTGALRRSTRSFAEAFQSLILGLGERWPFDHEDTANLVDDPFSTKGLGVISGAARFVFGVGADGARVFNREGETESQFGDGAIASTLAINNLLSADVRDVEGIDTTGFSVVAGGVLSLDTVNFLQGAQSLKVVSATVGDGVAVSVGDTGPTAFVGVVYIKPTTNPENDIITIDLLDDIVGVIDTVDIDQFDATGKWVKAIVFGTTDASATKAILQITGDPTTFFCDAFMLAQGGLNHSVWVDGNFAPSALRYSPTFLTTEDVTVSVWIRVDATVQGVDRKIVFISKDVTGTSGICLERLVGSTRIRFLTEDEDGNSEFIQTASAVLDGAWHHVVAVMRANPETGDNKKTLYFDGVSVGTSNPAGLPDVSKFTEINIGNKNGAELFYSGHRGLIDNVSILPYAAHSDQVAGWFALGEAQGDLPRIKASGDFVGDTQVIVEGELPSDSEYRAFTDSDGVHRNAGQEVPFALHEV